MMFQATDMIPHPSYFQNPQVEAGSSKGQLNKGGKNAFEEIEFLFWSNSMWQDVLCHFAPEHVRMKCFYENAHNLQFP
jgi:hypothetical protein